MNKMTERKKNIQSKKFIKKKHPRSPFTKEEDDLLKKMVEKFGDKNWELVSKKVPHRNARQCRDRWLNYLSPKVINIPWTKEEDELLVKKYEELGPLWKKIANFFPNRTDISIKSRWKLRERRINKEKLMFAKRIYYQRILHLSSAPFVDRNKKDVSIENSMRGQFIGHNDYVAYNLKNDENIYKSQMNKIGDESGLFEEFLNELAKEFEDIF